ncbi:MAG TPA: sodium:solute symporter family protein [Methylovorus sp.]|jgi:solute:Na+ symporter, SSS family|nr:sodium:solute symporter family protein [Methylovorus sp.]
MTITFGIMLVFFAGLIVILQRIRLSDHSFSSYAVGDRSFGARYQAMSFLNTWYPGAMFTAFGGMAAASGIISFYVLSYSLLTVMLMYMMAKPVWLWGKAFDLKTQPDLFALRYDSRHIRTIAAVIGIVSGIPWLILGMQALGEMFRYLSLGSLSFSQAVILGVFVIAIRQIWTVRIGMRGVVISDFYQGLMAYGVGTIMLVGLIFWLINMQGISFSSLDATRFSLPGPGSKEGPLFLFSLILTGALGGWCWPYIFVRLFTANGVASLKKSAALAIPLSFIFCLALLIFGMLAGTLPSTIGHSEDVWFIASHEAGGLMLLGLAGTVLLAASMGHIDGNIQATGAQIANDLLGNYLTLSTRQLIIVSKTGMLLLTLLASWLSCMSLPALFSLAVLAYQGIIQLAVPQFMGIFWKRGNKYGAIASMSLGFTVAVVLELVYHGSLPWAYGLTSGAIALIVNVMVYVLLAYLLPQSAPEKARVATLFEMVATHQATQTDTELTY